MVRIYDAEFAANGNKHWHLAKFWWVSDTGQKGTWSRLEGYNYVSANRGAVYVAEGGLKVLVYPKFDQNTGTKWVQTYSDGVWKDNLTALAQRHAHGLANR
jgi:hypothetical protein